MQNLLIAWPQGNRKPSACASTDKWTQRSRHLHPYADTIALLYSQNGGRFWYSKVSFPAWWSNTIAAVSAQHAASLLGLPYGTAGSGSGVTIRNNEKPMHTLLNMLTCLTILHHSTTIWIVLQHNWALVTCCQGDRGSQRGLPSCAPSKAFCCFYAWHCTRICTVLLLRVVRQI